MKQMKIAIGGMIASGKSTLAKNLGKSLGMAVLDEFENDDVVFDTLLKWLYEGVPNIEILLQIYFIHNHYLRQKKYGHNFVVDRDLIEHWIFAKTNLEKHPEVMNMYNGIFMAYMNQITLPDLYLILDVSFDDVIKRIKNRGRSSEVDNLDDNYDYFKELHSTYLDKLKAQCIIYNIPYVVIDTTDKTEDEILEVAIKYVNDLD